jgi:tetratricopeptide (TPR) repeat protein
MCLVLVVLLPAGVACRRSNEQSLRAAAEAWDSGDYKAAAEEYEAYLQLNPTGGESLEARFQLANIYYLNLKSYEQARAHYREFLSQSTADADAALARERLAEVLAELGRSFEAISEYESLNPTEARARRRVRLRIADLYFDQRNFSQALTEYAKVIEGSPYDELSEQAHLREASIHHIARGHYQQALPVYQKLAAESGDPRVYRTAMYGIADCYAGMFQFDEAIKALREIEDEGEQPFINRRIAEMEQQKRESANARSKVEQR